MKRTLIHLLLACLAASHASGARAQNPTIQFILVDDLGYADLGCQGSEDIRTPKTDTLAATGI
tara:strand:- start:222 stop:410 length:189 start_codon:yes stop_codon:yes gene_type:complete